jgi:hypothetical protein
VVVINITLCRETQVDNLQRIQIVWVLEHDILGLDVAVDDVVGVDVCYGFKDTLAIWNERLP